MNFEFISGIFKSSLALIDMPNKIFREQKRQQATWKFKHELHNLMRCKMLSKDSVWQKIHEFLPMITQLKESQLDSLKTLGDTLYSWRDEIGRM